MCLRSVAGREPSARGLRSATGTWGWNRTSGPGRWPASGSAQSALVRSVGHFRRYEPEALEALLSGCGFTDIQIRRYGFPLGYLLEAVRNAVSRRRLASAAATSAAERTAGSGRLLQPSSGIRGTATRWGSAPFRLAQRAFPDKGPGLVAIARLGG